MRLALVAALAVGVVVASAAVASIALVMPSGARVARQASPGLGCLPSAATPVAVVRTSEEEIAIALDLLFACLTAREWEALATFTAFPPGERDPLVTLRELEATGVVSITTGRRSQAVRMISPTVATVELAWMVGRQARHERWTLHRLGGRWRVVLIEPGTPQFDGTYVGITGQVSADEIRLGRSALVSPGGMELLLEVGGDVARGTLLVIYPAGACEADTPEALVGVLDLRAGMTSTILLEGVTDGDYRLTLVPPNPPLRRAALCEGPTTILSITTAASTGGDSP